jgi:alpha-L-fucosidase 2
VTLVYSAATSYRNYKDISGDAQAICRKLLDAAAGKTLAQLREAHVADVRALFNRVTLDLGGADAAQRPTDERVAAVAQGAADPLLVAQSFQFGRYLLIAGSRPGAQPLNLQGIWNETTKPAWGAKWTLNLNAEINYWPVETCNLSECHEPLLRMVEELREPGRVTAKINYNCRGWVAHHNTDIWHGTAVVDSFAFGAFTASGGWLCRHLWEHYDFTRDKAFLARTYPTMKEAALFYVDFLIPDASGHLITSPSISLEQPFRTPDGRKGVLCAGPTVDMQILRDLFTHCIAASEILGVDAEFRGKLKEVRARLIPTSISARTGQIQEWPEDWEATFGGNQLAPLWGLNPGDEITPWTTPALAAAAKKTLLEREMWFGSWASAFRVNYAARLGDGTLAEQMLDRHKRGHIAPSLLSLFSNRWGFQIDGNLGVTAGIAEMLLQSHGGIITFLPALPPSWPTGKVTGLRARGNFTVDIEWKNGKVTGYRIASPQPREVEVRVNGEVKTVTAEKL